jgi:hypothetical protein
MEHTGCQRFVSLLVSPAVSAPELLIGSVCLPDFPSSFSPQAQPSVQAVEQPGEESDATEGHRAFCLAAKRRLKKPGFIFFFSGKEGSTPN